MIHCFFLISRHGRSRLTKWYSSNLTQYEKQRILKEVLMMGVRSTSWLSLVTPKCAISSNIRNTRQFISATQVFISSQLLTRIKINLLSLNSCRHSSKCSTSTLGMFANWTLFLTSTKQFQLHSDLFYLRLNFDCWLFQ